MTEDEEIAAARGARAEHELRETSKAFESLRQGLFETIAKSGMTETELREKCYLALMILDGVKSLLTATAGDKAIAEYSQTIREIMSGRAE